MKFKSSVFALFGSLVLSSTLASTAYAKNDNNKKVTDLVKNLTENQVTVVKTFPSVENLIGVVVKPANSSEGQSSILYVDKDGKYIFSGALITPDGQNQTQADGKKYVGSKIAENAYKEVNKTAWIQDGNKDAKHMIYVVADPNCIFCHKFFQQTRSAVKNGDLSIRWIWVGFLKPDSKDLAQAILAAKDPIKAINTNENNFDDKAEQGGLKPLKNPSKTVTKKFKQNMAFMNKYQFPGTPVILYKDQKGQAQASFGLPTKEELTDILKNAQPE